MAEEFVHKIGSVKVDFTNSITYEVVGITHSIGEQELLPTHVIGSITKTFDNSVNTQTLEPKALSHPIWNAFSAGNQVLVTNITSRVYVLGKTMVYPERIVKITIQ